MGANKEHPDRADLSAMLREAERLCRGVSASVFSRIVEADTSGSGVALNSLRAKFNARWMTALRKYQEASSVLPSGSRALESAVVELERSWHSAIRTYWESSWSSGYRARGRQPPTTSRLIYQESPQLRAEVERQLAHSSRFAQEIASGDINRPVVYKDGRVRPRMSIGNRSQTYSRAMNAAYQWGAVSGGGPGEQIYWRLGACDHCVDCPALAASGPYTRQTLPTVPGQGLTRCSHNCCCILVFKPGVAPDRQAPDDIFIDTLGEPTPLPGFRAPGDKELSVILDLEARMNFARRKMAELRGTPEAQKWSSIRKRVNGELIDFIDGRDIYWTPRFSVPEVIDGLDISMKDVGSMMLRGADGFTVNAADLPKIVAEIAASVAEIEALVSGTGIAGPTPEVPPMDEILRALGLLPGDET